MKREWVLVFRRTLFAELGLFQGYTRDSDRYLSAILTPGKAFFVDREIAEGNADYKQLIPYVILRFHELIFVYRRGLRSSETRLRGRISIGIGGHITEGDVGNEPLIHEAYRRGARREVEEEVELLSPYEDRIIGLINDDSDEVGRVHFGVIHLWDLREPRVKGREKQIVEGRFMNLAEVQRRKGDLEGWSTIALEVVKDVVRSSAE